MIGWLLIAIALVEVWLGFWFLTKYQKNQATLWYGLFSFAAALYVGANGFGYLGEYISGDTAEHLAWTGGFMTAVFFLPFSFNFPLPTKSTQEVLPWVLWPAAIFIPGLLFTDLFVARSSIVAFGPGYATATGDFFWSMIVIFAGYWLWSLTNLVRAWRRADGMHKRNVQLVTVGIIVSLLVSAAFDIILPLNAATKYGFVGSLFTSVWLGVTGYILVKK